MLWRAIAVVTALATSAVLVGNVLVARSYFGQIGNPVDLLITALPIAFIIVALLTSLAVGTIKPAGTAIEGVLRGAYVASNIVVVFLAWQLWNNSDLLANDGTAYWGLMFLPCFWFGIPILVISVGLGVAVQGVRRPTPDAR